MRAMRERDFSNPTHQKKNSLTKKLVISLFIILFVSLAFAESGQIHLIYTNGVLSINDNSSSYEFDVQAYMTDGSDVIGDGMIYVQYPQNIFGDHIVSNGVVSVQKTGILSGTINNSTTERYNIVNVTDTYSGVFAVTFGSNTSSSSLKEYFTPISSDPASPSDLLHITMDVTVIGTGTVFFPSGIPGTDMLYFDYEFETFSGGLDLSQANEAVSYTDTIDVIPEDPGTIPTFNGNVDLNRFMASSKKGSVELTWRVSSEKRLVEYVIERSSDSGDYNETGRIGVKIPHNKFNTYTMSDKLVVPGTNYHYRLSAVDENGVSKVISSLDITLRSKPNRILETGEFTLEASYPNPFNPSFTVPFSIQKAQDIDIRLYNTYGELVSIVANGYYTPGEYNIHVSGDNLASGVYLLRAQVNGQQATQKMLLVK